MIVLAGVAAYSNSFAGVFVFDDEPAIAHNANLQSLWPLTTAVTAPRDTTLAGRPFATLTFALDHAISGGTLTQYHATNLVIHLIASLILFGVLRRTLGEMGRTDASARAQAFVVALLFVVHPLQTGSVTYIVQRVESLMGLLYLATLYASIRAHDPSLPARRFWTGLAILACALGMATKEVMVTAPLMVLLWDRQFGGESVTSRKPLYAGLAATWALLLALVVGGYRSASVGLQFEGWPWWRYLMTQAEVITHYIRLSFWPSPLVLDYDWPPAASFAAAALPGALVLALLALTVWGSVRRFPAPFAGAWFFLILAPTSSVLPIVTEVAAEHRLYLPLAAVLAVSVLVLAELGGRASARNLVWSRIAKPVALLVIFALSATFIVMTRARNIDYESFERIWLDTIEKRPRNARARNNYASSLLTAGRFVDAEPHLRVAVQEKPSDAEAQANLGVALSAQGKLDEGALHLQRAVDLKPDYAEAHRNLGENFGMRHRLGDALTSYLRALELRPNDILLLNRVSWILATTPDDRIRDAQRSRGFAERAIQLSQGQNADALDTLAAAFAESGDFDAASATALKALEAARSVGDGRLAADIARRLDLYARRQTFREP